MRLLVLAALMAASPAGASRFSASESLYPGSGGYLGQDFNAGVVTTGGRWGGSTRIKSFRKTGSFSGTEAEFSAGITRRLPHVTIGGRVGTAPPNAQRASYHVAGGEALLTWYGLTLGPSEADDALTVSEDTTTAAAFTGLDRTWVTTMRTRFTTTNHRQTPPSRTAPDFAVVQNSWQFDFALAWKSRAKLTLSGGGDRYSHPLLRTDPTWYLWNVDYGGAPIAVRGWPNNHLGARLEQKVGNFTTSAGFTRLNMLSNGLEVLTGGEAAWRPRGGPAELRLGLFSRNTRGRDTSTVWALGGGWNF